MNENIENIQNKQEKENQNSQNSDSESEQDSGVLSKNSKLINSVKESDSKSNKSRDIEIIPEEINTCDLSFKLIIIGDSSVGKSSLANKAIKNKFDTVYNATLGFDFFSFFVKIDEKIIKLQIWDTCGQEIYHSLITNFYRNSSLAIMVYAINNRASYEHIDFWLKEIKRNSNPDAKIFLIGNKNDLDEEREVTFEEAQKYADDLEFSNFFESSAKSGFNAQKIFIKAANILYDDFIEYTTESHNTSTVSESNDRKKLNDTKDTNEAQKSKCKECC